MGFINNILGEQGMENFKLAESTPGKQFTSQESIKPYKPLYRFQDLEYCYRSDALTFNGINKSVQKIMAGGFKGFIHSKKYVVTKFTNFFEEIGDIGNDITFEELLKGIFRDQMVYGNAFVEIIFDESDTKIADVSLIDPKRIDYAKNSEGKIILDSTGKPIGYSVKLESGTSAVGDKIPEKYERKVRRDNDTIFILFKRICHFKLYTIGDGFYGIGLIEPAYKSGIYKKNMEKAKANFVYLKGFPQIVAYVGSDRRMATPADIKAVEKQINTTDYQRNFTFPEWVKLDSTKFSESNLSQESLKDMRIDQISALGIPDAVASGQGQTANKQTLSKQSVEWEFTLKDLINTTMACFKKYLLKPIDKYNNYGGIPDIEWGELRAEDTDVTLGQIIRLLTSKSANITPELVDDLEGELREIMSIKISKRENSKKIRKAEKENDGEMDKIKELISNKDKKTSEEIKGKLESINHKLSENVKKLESLEKEKKEMEEKYKLELEKMKEKDKLSTSEKEIHEKNKELENKIDNLTNEIKLKFDERDKIIKDSTDLISSIKDASWLKDEENERLIKLKNIEIMKKKEDLIKKLSEKLENE